jgi:hypothetical protein
MMFADASARTGFSYLPEHVGKMIWQLDDDSFYILVDDSPATFATFTAVATTFIGHADTPGTYSGQGSKVMRVNAGATAVEFSGLLIDASDALQMADNQIVRAELLDYGVTVNALGSSTGSVDLDLETGNTFTLTQTGNITYTFSNPPPSGAKGSITLVHTMDGTGGYTRTWPGTVDWAGGSAPAPNTGADQVDIYTFFTVDGGTTWYGFMPGGDVF